MEQMNSPARQLRTLKDFYRLTTAYIVKKSGVSVATVQKALNGKDAVDLRKLVKIADAMNADVVITLKAREQDIQQHLQALLSEVSDIQ